MIQVNILVQKPYNDSTIIRGIEIVGHALEKDNITNSHLCEEVSAITSALYVLDSHHTIHCSKGYFRYEWILEEKKQVINSCMSYIELMLAYLKVLSEKYRGMISFERKKLTY